MIDTFLIFKMYKYDWISIVLISIVALIALNNFIYEKRFRSLLVDFFNNKYYMKYVRNTPIIINTFNIIFLIINLLTIGLISFFFLEYYYPNTFSIYNFESYLIIIGLILGYYIVKGTLSFIFNYILENLEQSRKFLFYKINIRNISSVISLIFIAIHQYSTFSSHTTLVVLLSVFSAVNVLGYLFSSFQLVTKNKQATYQIILYLCTLEIAPLLIYVKTALLLMNSDF
ncbi:MAG: DUF4271 domain-containing protein [Flavobacteriales bacterium]|nr:DUF4271 domain-containing protein [Flavobacteriales bacterium]